MCKLSSHVSQYCGCVEHEAGLAAGLELQVGLRAVELHLQPPGLERELDLGRVR